MLSSYNDMIILSIKKMSRLKLTAAKTNEIIYIESI